MAIEDEASRPLHVLSVALDTDHPAGGADALSEKTETAPRAATDFDDRPPFPNTNVVK
jgi:hypothetical protein